MNKIKVNDAEAQSADIVADNLSQLKSLFPEAFAEGKVQFDTLRQLLGGAVDEADEKYGLNWHGKRRARQIALTPSTGTLRPCPDESVDWDTTQNLMIEGDNLEVLKLLQKSYAGKIKLIYIDPPYNTGKDFVYPDDFQDSLKSYLEITGQVEGGKKITANTESSGRFHTDWLNMMYPRLRLARSLLQDNGALMISIDEKELQHLRLLANEIFGEENFIATISVVSNMKGRNDKKHIAACHEYIVLYASPKFVSNGLPLTEEQKAAFKFIDDSGYKYALRDLRKRGGPDRREDRPKMFFPIYWNTTADRCFIERTSDADIKILPYRGDGTEGRWRWGKEKVMKHLDWLKAKRSERTGRLDIEHRIYLDPSKSLDTEIEDEFEDDDDEAIERTSKPKSIWIGGEFSSDNGKRSLKELLPGTAFDFPKSVELIRTCVLLATSKNDIVLDFFAGSATTSQAVMAQNAIDGHSRRFIMVQLPEILDAKDKDQKAAAAFCDSIGRPRNLAELTKERIRRAGKKIKDDSPLFSGDTGFRVFKLDKSNIREWNPDADNISKSLLDHHEHILEGRTEADIVYELLLKLGLDLCVPMESRTVAGKTVEAVGGGVLMLCLAEKISAKEVEAVAAGIVSWHKELAPAGDSTVVFRDSAFADDIAKTNMAAILAQNDLENVRSL